MPEIDPNARLKGTYQKHAENVDKCVFCDLKDKYVVIRQEGWVLTVNIFPYINGQVLVLPVRHIENFEELTDDDILTGNHLVKRGMDLLKKEMGIENFWVILRQGKIAGKTVRHLHLNIMPYIDGINTWHNQEITVMPQDLADRLRGRYERT